MIKIVVALKFYKGEISPFDESALECALRYPNSEVVLLAMAPPTVKPRLEYFTRLGAKKAVLVSDGIYAGSDTLATAKTLAAAVKLLKPDLVLCGRQSMNGDTAQVPPELAVLSGFDFVPYAMEVKPSPVNTRLGEVKFALPAVMSVEKIAPLRLPRITSAVAPIEVWDNSVLKLNPKEAGLDGSPTKVLAVYENKREAKRCEVISKDKLLDAITAALEKPKAEVKRETSGEKLELIFYVGDELAGTARGLAKEAVRLKEGNAEELVEELTRLNAETVLFPADLRYRAVAPQVAAMLNAGLAADCIDLNVENGRLIMLRPAAAESTIAKVMSVSAVRLATVRSKTESGEIVIGVGMGAVDYLDKIREFAAKLNAEVVCTRRVADSGILPYGAQVGLTGRIIAPKVYVAMGISGAIQHAVGFERSGTVIAVNKDKNAKIFEYAHFGVEEDIKNVEL